MNMPLYERQLNYRLNGMKASVAKIGTTGVTGSYLYDTGCAE
jgi:hypothetical protein